MCQSAAHLNTFLFRGFKPLFFPIMKFTTTLSTVVSWGGLVCVTTSLLLTW